MDEDQPQVRVTGLFMQAYVESLKVELAGQEQKRDLHIVEAMKAVGRADMVRDLIAFHLAQDAQRPAQDQDPPLDGDGADPEGAETTE